MENKACILFLFDLFFAQSSKINIFHFSIFPTLKIQCFCNAKKANKTKKLNKHELITFSFKPWVKISFELVNLRLKRTTYLRPTMIQKKQTIKNKVTDHCLCQLQGKNVYKTRKHLCQIMKSNKKLISQCL